MYRCSSRAGMTIEKHVSGVVWCERSGITPGHLKPIGMGRVMRRNFVQHAIELQRWGPVERRPHTSAIHHDPRNVPLPRRWVWLYDVLPEMLAAPAAQLRQRHRVARPATNGP